MSEQTLTESGAALREEFYSGDAAALREELADASGVADEAVLSRLVDLGFRADTLAALTLVPLVEVAWADDRMDERERASILKGAVTTGMDEDSLSYRLLHIWTHDRPPPSLFSAWADFIEQIVSQLSRSERDNIRDRLVGRAREVAAAAGARRDSAPGVSAAEQRVLDRLAAVFHR